MPAPSSGWWSRAMRPVVRSLADLRGKRVGIVAGTVAIAEKDHALARFKTREELLDGFGAAALDAAFLDADFAAWYLHEHPTARVSGSSTRSCLASAGTWPWRYAPATRSSWWRSTGPWPSSPSRASCGRIYADYGVPFHAPFTASGRAAEAPPDTWRRIRDRGELVVSMDPANLPYSSAKDDRPGFDVELARALADRLHVKLRLDWLDIHRETAVGELIQGRCDLVFGEAVATNAVADDEPLAGKILYSRPYYGTGYVLVRRKDGPRVRSLARAQGRSVAAAGHRGRLGRRLPAPPAGLPPPPVPQPAGRAQGAGRRRHRLRLPLGQRRLDPARLARPRPKLEIVPGFEPEDRWNIAVAMRRGDDELKRQVDAATRHADRRWDRRPCPGPLPRAGSGPSPSRPAMARRHRAVGSITESPTGAASLRMQRSRRPSILTPPWPGSDRPASWWWAWIRTTSRSRRPTPARRARLRDRRPARRSSSGCRSGCTGRFPRTTRTPRSWRPSSSAT